MNELSTKARCPYCNAGWKNIQAKSLTEAIIVFYCGKCGAIYGVAPSGNQPKKPVDEPTQPGHARIMEIIGHANLEEKRRQYNIKMERRMMAAKQARTMYRQVADYTGPPYCEDCKQDMTQIVIPSRYPNSGEKVWICAKCDNWEAV